jgi:peroxiredoxin (alkyl hydroperoxide reductase subunit C)
MRTINTLRRFTRASSALLNLTTRSGANALVGRSLMTVSSPQVKKNAVVVTVASEEFNGVAKRFFSSEDEVYFDEATDDFVQYPPTAVEIGLPAPSFTAEAVVDGEITTLSLDQYKGKHVVLFFYPKDFTYVCPTEIIAFNDRAREFEELNTQLIAVSVDSPESHLAWTKLSRSKGGLGTMTIPLVSDLTKVISAKYGVLKPEIGIALRGLFIINPQGELQQITVNNFPIGRSVDETLRLIKAIQFNEKHGEVCPANWQPGEKTIVADAKEAQKYFSTLKDTEAEGDAKISVVKTKQEFDDILKSGESVVAKFMAPWCGKCEKILPFVRELANEYDNVKFVKLDVSIPELDKVKESLKVEAFPEFRFFKGGKEVAAPVTGYKKTPLKDAVSKL